MNDILILKAGEKLIEIKDSSSLITQLSSLGNNREINLLKASTIAEWHQTQYSPQPVQSHPEPQFTDTEIETAPFELQPMRDDSITEPEDWDKCNANKHWSEFERKFALDSRGVYTNRELAIILHRSESAIDKLLGSSCSARYPNNGKHWTNKDDSTLILMYGKSASREEMAEALGRSTGSIRNRIGVLRAERRLPKRGSLLA